MKDPGPDVSELEDARKRLAGLKGSSGLLDDDNIEIAGGFGPLKGRVFRVGLIAFSRRRENLALPLATLRAMKMNG